MNVAAIVIAAVFVVGIAFLIGAVKIVRPYQRGLVERLGRYRATKEPGFNLIMPFVERMQLVDMREQVVDVPPQEVITETTSSSRSTPSSTRRLLSNSLFV